MTPFAQPSMRRCIELGAVRDGFLRDAAQLLLLENLLRDHSWPAAG